MKKNPILSGLIAASVVMTFSIATYAGDYKIVFTNKNIDIPDASSIQYESCQKILENNASQGSGTYTIYPNNNDGVDVYCDMETDGGGWTVLMGSNAVNNTLFFSEWENSNGFTVSKNSISINRIQCGNNEIRGGAVISDNQFPVSYDEVKYSLNWNGNGGGDSCEGGGTRDGVWVNNNRATTGSRTTGTTTQLNDITFSCECFDYNQQGGTSNGTIKVR